MLLCWMPADLPIPTSKHILCNAPCSVTSTSIKNKYISLALEVHNAYGMKFRRPITAVFRHMSVMNVTVLQ